jgi:hypothetical protein
MTVLFSTVHREMEHISRGPTFGDFVTMRIQGTMQDVMVQDYRVQDYGTISSLPTLLNVMYGTA